MLKKKKILITISALALLTLITTAFVSSNENQTNIKYENSFLDVKDSDWFSADVQYVKEKELMSGTSDTAFSPNETTTRAMLVTILWRLEGKPKINTNNNFEDVGEDQYYNNAVSWASVNQIVNGYSETHFAPDDSMTREQLAAVLYRYANHKQYDTSGKSNLASYKDAELISEYAVDAFKWANANEIINGTSADTLEPQGNAQRAQIASILHRFCEKYVDNNIEEQNKANNISEQNEKKAHNTDEQNVKNADYAEFDIDENNETDKQKEHSYSSGSSSSGATSQNTSTTNEDQNENDQTQNPVEIVPNTEPTIIVDNVTAKSGSSVQFIARIENNPGILGMTLTANYDENILTLESVENGEAFNGILDLTTSKELKSGSRFVWDGVDIPDDNIKNGTMLIMNFKISDQYLIFSIKIK